MSLHEMLPALRSLPRGEKVRVIHLLARDLAGEDAAGLPELPPVCEVWSTCTTFEGAQILSDLLRTREGVS